MFDGARSKSWVPLAPMIAFCACLFVVIGGCFEAGSEGPLTTAFNHRLRHRAEAAGLVGRPETDVQRVMGTASDDYDTSGYIIDSSGQATPIGGPSHTYDYYPYPWTPFSKFQVHCTAGVVTALEEFDD